jgi:hypothetical protein
MISVPFVDTVPLLVVNPISLTQSVRAGAEVGSSLSGRGDHVDGQPDGAYPYPYSYPYKLWKALDLNDGVNERIDACELCEIISIS